MAIYYFDVSNVSRKLRQKNRLRLLLLLHTKTEPDTQTNEPVQHTTTPKKGGYTTQAF